MVWNFPQSSASQVPTPVNLNWCQGAVAVYTSSLFIQTYLSSRTWVGPGLSLSAVHYTCVRFEVLTAVVMKSTIFWDITPCSPLKVNRHFGGTYCHFLSLWFLAWLIFRPWRWRRHIPRKRRLTFNGQNGVISLNLVLFIYYTCRT
jgi:hypothetical protein